MSVSSSVGLRICAPVLVLALCAAPLLADQAPAQLAAAPIPTQVLTARKVFISNAGVNGIGFAILQRAGDADQPYNQFYAAVKGWGRFEVVGAPSDADLVLELRFDSALLALTIVDSKTHFILWTITEPVEYANLAKTWRKNIGLGITNLVTEMKGVVAEPTPGGAKL